MKIDGKKLAESLADFGMHPKRIPYFVHTLETSLRYASDEEAEWSLAHGFMPDDASKLHLTEANHRDYLAAFDYFMGFPHNNHFAFWINDKLTLKYVCRHGSVAKYLPKYFLYVENDGSYTYLADSPADVPCGADYLLALAKREGDLAMKPNNGSLGSGFVRLQWIDGGPVANGKALDAAGFEALKETLNGYVVTEYVAQHPRLDEIWSGAVCTLRVIMYKRPRRDRFARAEFNALVSYARFGTSVSGATSNLAQGGLSVPFDFETGELLRGGVRWPEFRAPGETLLERHPDTGAKLAGFRLPFADEIRSACLDVSRHLSSLDYFGYDLFVGRDGVKLCEINSLPGLSENQTFVGGFLSSPEAREFYEGKRRKDYPRDAFYRLVKACVVPECASRKD